MTIEIPLRADRVALIDDEDLAIVAGYKWSFLKRKDGRGGYAIASRRGEDGKSKMLAMHRLLLNPQNGLHVDHVNGDGLDNRRANIRVCTQSQNAANRPHRGEYRGVVKRGLGFAANIWCSPCHYFLGVFSTAQDAARAYDAASRILHGEFGRRNFPNEPSVELSPITYTSYRDQPPHPAIADICRRPPRRQTWAEWKEHLKAFDAARAKAKKDRDADISRVRLLNAPLLAKFTTRDAAIIARKAAGESGAPIAADFGVTKQRVSQIVRRATKLGVAFVAVRRAA